MTNMSTERLEEMRLIAEARDFCRHPNIHFHYTDGARVMSGLADAVERRSLDKGEVVKPLEWGAEEHGVRRKVFGIRANTSIGQYFIEDMGPSAKEGRRYALQHDQMLTQWHPSYEEAKAAAQADFETRIRSTLVSQPAPKGVTGSLTLDTDDLDTIEAVGRNEQSGRVTNYELKELVRVYRAALEAAQGEG